MIKQIITKDDAYYPYQVEPDGSDFCRIMSQIAKKPSDIVNEFTTNVAVKEDAEKYMGKITGIRYEGTAPAESFPYSYKFYITWDSDKDFDATSEDLYAFFGGIIIPLHDSSYDDDGQFSSETAQILIREAEHEGNFELGEGTVEGSVWKKDTGPDKLNISYDCIWQDKSPTPIDNEEFERAGLKVRKSGHSSKYTDWKRLTHTTGMKAEIAASRMKINLQTGIAIEPDANSKYSPKYIYFNAVSDVGDDIEISIKVYLHITNINYDELSLFSTISDQRWASVSTVSGSYLSSSLYDANGYYDGVDFGDGDASGYRTPEELYIYRINSIITFPLYFIKKNSWNITNYQYVDYKQSQIEKFGSFACCSKKSYLNTAIDREFRSYYYRHMGYYGRDASFTGGSTNCATPVDFAEDIFIPGNIKKTVLSKRTDGNKQNINVEETGNKIKFNFRDIIAFEGEDAVVDENNHIRQYLLNRAAKSVTIINIDIFNIYIESIKLWDDSKTIKATNDENIGLFYDDGEDYTHLIDTDYIPNDSLYVVGDVTDFAEPGIIYINGEERAEYETLAYAFNDDRTSIGLKNDMDRKYYEGEEVEFALVPMYREEKCGEVESIEESSIVVSMDDIDLSDYGYTAENDEGVIAIGNEFIYFETYTDEEDGTYTFNNVERGYRGTNEATHSVGDDVYLYEYLMLGDNFMREDNYSIDYTGDYKAKITLDKASYDEEDVGESKRAYYVEVTWSTA